MSRQTVRQWKKGLRASTRAPSDLEAAGAARDCALALLDRSITFGHRRLAVLRLVGAVRSGAQVPEASWAYCREAVQASADPALRSLFDEVAHG